MNRNISGSIKREYERRRQAAFDRLLQKEEEVYARLPALSRIADEIKAAGIRYNRALLMGNRPAHEVAEELPVKIDRLKREKEKLLAAAGYPEDYLEMEYECSKCRDTGYVDQGNGLDRCVCYRKLLINSLYDQSNLKKMIANENFDLFSEEYFSPAVDGNKYGIDISPRENIRDIKDSCLEFVKNFHSSSEKNLFFSGPTGTGKTFMANCIAKALVDRGYPILYQTAPMLFNTINEFRIRSYKEGAYDDSDYRNIFEVELLIIDDLGTESPSDARYAELLNILNTRHIINMTRPCKTIISTNIGLKKLHEYYDERIVSRIIGGFNIFRFIGEDIRSVKKFAEKK